MTAAPSPYSVLAEATALVLEPAAYRQAIELGVAGSVELAERFLADGFNWADALQCEQVIFRRDRIQVARHQVDQFGAVAAFVFAVREAEGDITDVAAWDPAEGRIGTMLGKVGALGLPALRRVRLDPPLVWPTVREWLRAGRDGLFILDDRLAAAELDGVTIAATDYPAGRALRARLAPYSSRSPKIIIPQSRSHRRHG